MTLICLWLLLYFCGCIEIFLGYLKFPVQFVGYVCFVQECTVSLGVVGMLFFVALCR
jgi:hypothetical protein